MKKGLVVFLVVLFVGAKGVIVGGGEEAIVADAKTITAGVNSENPPWIFAKDGNMIDFEADLLEAFAKRAGYKIDYKSTPFTNVLRTGTVFQSFQL